MDSPTTSTETGLESKAKTRRKWRATIEDAERWASKYRKRTSILKIAEEEGVSPPTVSAWLRKVGIEVRPGQHFVPQPPLKYPEVLQDLALRGPKAVIECVRENVWGVQVTGKGLAQVEKFCSFNSMHKEGLGVKEIARKLGANRTTIASWREGKDQPYLIRIASTACQARLDPGWKMLPVHLASGAEEQYDWIQVPTEIRDYSDVARVISQLQMKSEATAVASAAEFGVGGDQLKGIRGDLFGYLLGMMVGDSSKSGGQQQRFASMNLDLQLTLKEPSNERLGKFVCLCANMAGIGMNRIADKEPTGSTRFGREPSAAYRWTSERSPLIAWMFSVALGLGWNQKTSYDPIRVDWIFSAPRSFRLRFVQGLADSDATVKPYEIVITSVPNAGLLTAILKSLGMASAHTVSEKGKALRTMVSRREGGTLPIFNEIVKGYRYGKLMQRFKR